jgi:hypothetical protein
MKSHERIGSHRAANPRRPEYGLPERAETPEGALETSHVLAHDAETAPRSDVGRRVATRKRNGLGQTPRADVDNNARRGMGCREASRQFGRGNL